jgi:hypothetical protein
MILVAMCGRREKWENGSEMQNEKIRGSFQIPGIC